jgi:uncharacterized C2H2 Zn-finger protein
MQEDPKVNCEYLKDGNCQSIVSNEEAKEARKVGCNNDNEQSCCYLCSYYHGCEISCAFLGENKRLIKRKIAIADEKQINFLRCPQCDQKMVYNQVSLRVGGWSGALKGLHPALDMMGELGEELIPVLLYVCPKCGKLEFRAQAKAKERLINNSLGTFLH